MLSTIIFSLMFYTNAAAGTLPQGFENAGWGTSVDTIQQSKKLHKAKPGSEYSYADHMEVNPDVYILKEKQQRVEYYFFQQKLYKVFIIHHRNNADYDAYLKLVNQFSQQYGKPEKQYQETVFGIHVLHSVWSDEDSTLDIRSGAGFIYQVRIDKKAAAAKRLLQKFRHSI